jgi:hypothetical protein
MVPKPVADKFVSAIEAVFIKNVSEQTLESTGRALEWLTQNHEFLANLKSHESRS